MLVFGGTSRRDCPFSLFGHGECVKCICSMASIQGGVGIQKDWNASCAEEERKEGISSLTQEQKKTIDSVWEETRLGARLLNKELRRRGLRIRHHKLNRYLLETGRTVPNPRKQKKRSRCRYEREHSFSLVHGDWHRTTENHPHSIVWMDDASGMILSTGEFGEATAKHSIGTFAEAMGRAAGHRLSICRSCSTDCATCPRAWRPSLASSLFSTESAHRG